MRTSSTSACAARTLRDPRAPPIATTSTFLGPSSPRSQDAPRSNDQHERVELRSSRFAGLAIRAFPQARLARRSRSGVTVAVGAHESGASVKRSSTVAASRPIRPPIGRRSHNRLATTMPRDPGPQRQASRELRRAHPTPAPSSGTAAYTASTSPTEFSDVFSGSGFPIGDRGFAAWSLTASR